ncbi:MAG: tetratricopeptide repeat protein [Candidatus Acidiferrales bacterium]
MSLTRLSTLRRWGTVWLPLLAALALLPASLVGQRMPPGSESPPVDPDAGRPGTVVVRVRAVSGGPLSSFAMARLYTLFGPYDRTEFTKDGGEATFTEVPLGEYVIEVRAAGYTDYNGQVGMYSPGSRTYAHVEMVPESAVRTQPLPAGPPLLTARARKELESAVEALKKNNLKEAGERLRRAEKMAPNHPDVLYLLGMLAIHQNNFAEARSRLEKATRLDPRHTAAQEALGSLLVEMQDYAAAAPVLEQAAAFAPERWQAHWLLAVAFYQTERYPDAQGKAEKALGLPGADGAALRLLLAKIFQAQGDSERAIAQAQAVLQSHPKTREAVVARSLLAELRGVPAAEPAAAAAPLPVGTAEATLREVRWLPTGVDEVVPEVNPEVPCSLPDVLAGVGRRAQELVVNLGRFTATEHVEHTEINSQGLARFKNEMNFRYVAQVYEVRPGLLSIDEWRSGGAALYASGSGLVSSGLAAFGIIFHPYYVDDLQVQCEGLGHWRGQPAWQLYFRQREDREPRLRRYKVREGRAMVPLKGRAWVDVNSYQILRLETELLKPLPAIALEREQFLIEYHPVRFRERNAELWLPLNAELYIQYRGKRYLHRHSFSDYLLFSVDVDQRIRPPTEQPQP